MSLPPSDQDKFREVAESELLGLHEGNFARYRIGPAEFAAWHEAWARNAPSLGPDCDNP